MTSDRVDQTVVTEGTTVTPGPNPTPAPTPADPVQQSVRTESHRTTRTGPGATETIRRVVILVFGLIQIVIGARIVLLLLDAREANALVSAILDISQIFVAPFEGILRTDSLNSAGSVLDVAAIVAFVGWTIIELIVLWVVGIFRREPA